MQWKVALGWAARISTATCPCNVFFKNLLGHTKKAKKEKKGAALDKMEQHWTCQLSTAQGCYLLICLRFSNWKMQTQVQNGGIEKFHYHRGNFQRLGNEQATSWPFI